MWIFEKLFNRMELTDKIRKHIGEKHISLAISVDLKKGFNTQNDILISKVAHCGINGTALEWLTICVTSSSQCVEIAGVSSDIFSLSTPY